MTTLLPAPVDDAVRPGDSRDRRRLRRRLFRVGAVPLVLALLLAAKVAWLVYATHTADSAYDQHRFGDARHAYAAAGLVNVVEPWVAPYDEGTAAFQEGDYLTARSRLQQALREAPREEQCRVRINLAMSNEVLGDATLAAGKILDARTQWQTAHDLLAAGHCGTDPAAHVTGSVTRKLDSTRAAARAARSSQQDQDAAQVLRDRNRRADQEHQQEQEPDDRPSPSTPPDGGVPVYQW